MSKLILIVEDDAGILTLLEDVLSSEGYRVHSLTSWEQGVGLALVREIRPDLIITDMLVEGYKAGLTLITELHSETTTAHLPILLCTAAFHAKAEVEQIFSAEINNNSIKVLLKPFDLDELLEGVQQLLAHQASES